MCLTRQPVASGILASAVGFGVILVPKYYDLKILAWDLSVYVPRLGTLHLGTLLGLTVPPLLVAWFVVKRRLR